MGVHAGIADMVLPIDSIIALLIFLVGIPAIVLQFMSSDVRHVAMENMKPPREISWTLAGAALFIGSAWWLARIFPEEQETIWLVSLLLLFVLVSISAFLIVYRYGWREGIIGGIQNKALRKLQADRIPRRSQELADLLEIGKQSKGGPDRAIVLDALANLANAICAHKAYNGDSLVLLIDGLVKILATHPDAEDILNYQKAAEILTQILCAGSTADGSGLIDQQHAVRALSVLGQAFLADITISVETDYVLMNYVGALGIAVSRQPVLLTDVSQSLMEVGSVALEHGQYLFAVAALEQLLSMIEGTTEGVAAYSDEAIADLLGRIAHFWTRGVSSRELAENRIPRVKASLRGTFSDAMEEARAHSQMTMRFETADKLSQMKSELAGSQSTGLRSSTDETLTGVSSI